MFPHGLEQEMQQQPQILDARVALLRQGQQAVESPFERDKKLGDDLILVPEVVVQIPGTDLHLDGDVRGSDMRLAQTIEEQKRRLQDAFARAPRAFALRHGARG